MATGFGMQVFDASNNVVFDSTLAISFVPVGVFNVAAGAAGFTNTYPSLAGLTPKVVPFDMQGGGISSVAVDVALGYPRMIVSTFAAGPRSFILVVK